MWSTIHCLWQLNTARNSTNLHRKSLRTDVKMLQRRPVTGRRCCDTCSTALSGVACVHVYQPTGIHVCIAVRTSMCASMQHYQRQVRVPTCVGHWPRPGGAGNIKTPGLGAARAGSARKQVRPSGNPRPVTPLHDTPRAAYTMTVGRPYLDVNALGAVLLGQASRKLVYKGFARGVEAEQGCSSEECG